MANSRLESVAEELEAQAGALAGKDARILREKVEKELSDAEMSGASEELVNRLDRLLILLTDAMRENVCANTKCPHYSKKCKMR